MEHVYFRQYHDPNDEPSAEPIDIDIEGDNDLTIDHWRQLIWSEIEDFKREHPDFSFKTTTFGSDSVAENLDLTTIDEVVEHLQKDEKTADEDKSEPVTPVK